jgi:hypothetical protein
LDHSIHQGPEKLDAVGIDSLDESIYHEAVDGRPLDDFGWLHAFCCRSPKKSRIHNGVERNGVFDLRGKLVAGGCGWAAGFL